MRKLIFSLMAITLIASSPAFAQVTSSLGVYFDATAGNVAMQDGSGKLTGRSGSKAGKYEYSYAQNLFSGNEFEFGIWYRRNFESAQWLTFQMKALTVLNQNGVYEGDTITHTANPSANVQHVYSIKSAKYLGLDAGNPFRLVAGTPRAQLGLMLNSEALGFDGLYVGLYADTRTLIAFEAFYTLGFGDAGGLTFGAIVEFFANPFVYQTTTEGAIKNDGTIVTADDAKNKTAYYVLDVFELRIAYAIPFADIWSFSTQLGFRFQGPNANELETLSGVFAPAGFDLPGLGGGGNLDTAMQYASVKMWEENFISRLQIRWENQMNVSVGGLGLWARVRYNLNNLGWNNVLVKNVLGNDAWGAGGTGAAGVAKGFTLERKIEHEVVLQAGVSYSFDLSNLDT